MTVSGFRLRWRYLKSSFSWWFGLIWAAVGVVFVVVAVLLWLGEQRFSQSGVSATGTVLEKGYERIEEVDDQDDDISYWLSYRYQDIDEQEYIGQHDVSLNTWNRYREGDAVPIQYLQDNPGESRLAEDESTARWLLPAIFAGVGVLSGGTGGLLAARSFHGVGRRVRILRDGTPTQGRVISVLKKTSVKVNGRHPFYLTYEFTDARGERREGESSLLPLALESRWHADDPILVLYDRYDPSRHEVDLFGVRSDDPATTSSGFHSQYKRTSHYSSGRHHHTADEIEDAIEGEEEIGIDTGGGEDIGRRFRK